MQNKIRPALRRVMSAASWVDGNGNGFKDFPRNLNMVSMRGAYSPSVADATFLSPVNHAVLPSGRNAIANAGGRAFSGVTWSKPTVGANFRATGVASNGASVRFTITDTTTGTIAYDSGLLHNADQKDFAWPCENFRVSTYVANDPATGLAGWATVNVVPR
jgi:hypothetical protein